MEWELDLYSTMWWREELREGLLVEIFQDFTDRENTIPIHLYYMKRRHLHSKIRLFVIFIMNNVNKN